jgi:uncharacterized membrane protein YozB (DUF420 family)
LGAVVVVGANLANSYPSQDHPHGWPGAANFDGGVATVRPQLVLAATVPGLLLGLSTGTRLSPRRHGPLQAGAVLGVDVFLVAAACWLGTSIASWGVSKTSEEAYWAFFTAHLLLALCFYSLALLSAVTVPTSPALPAGVLWVLFAVVYEIWVRWKTLRAAGYEGLSAGAFPAWFFVAQAWSPLAVYRGLLILWHPGFRDYEERAVLGDLALPPWMNAPVFGALFAFAWVLLPLESAWVVWTLRQRRRGPLRGVQRTTRVPTSAGVRDRETPVTEVREA